MKEAAYRDFKLKPKFGDKGQLWLFYKDCLIESEGYIGGAHPHIEKRSMIDLYVDYVCHLEARAVPLQETLPQDHPVYPDFIELMDIIDKETKYGLKFSNSKQLKVKVLSDRFTELVQKESFDKVKLEAMEKSIKAALLESKQHIEIRYFSNFILNKRAWLQDYMLTSHEKYSQTAEYKKRRAMIEASASEGMGSLKDIEYETQITDPHYRFKDKESQLRWEDEVKRNMPLQQLFFPNPEDVGTDEKAGLKKRVKVATIKKMNRNERKKA